MRVAALGVAAWLAACGPGGEGSGPSAARGRAVYETNCTACHHPDPRLDGTLGPALAGSPKDLVEARVIRGEYPPGYTPKRETRLMVPLPHLAPYVDDIALYLGDLK